MANKKWVIRPSDKEYAKQLAEECEIDPLVALILSSRGIDDPVEIDEFLGDDFEFSDPFDLPDMERAVERINKAIEENQRIAVYGDYDADGVTASALLYSYLLEKGCNVMCYIPERLEDGYGLHNSTIDRLKQIDIELIITVDNGIGAADEVDYASSLGIDTVITDHHLAGEKIPNACAVVDPHLEESFCFRDYAGVGVAFMLVCALENQPCEIMIKKYGDLVALGTVADLVPLRSENRTLVRLGTNVMNQRKRPGLNMLLEGTSYSEKVLDSNAIAFTVAPRINAAGRMGKSMRAFKLLTSSDVEEAAQIAAEMEEDNTARKSIEAEITKDAVSQIVSNRLYNNRVIIVSGKGWHHGVLGIVAARLCERFGKPAVVISKENGIAKGSARSIEGFDLFAALSSCSDILIQVGGHKLAAGLTVDENRICELSERLEKYAANLDCDVVPKLYIDCRLNPLGATLDTFDAIRCLAPFGCENSEPVFALMGMTVHAIHSIGTSGKAIKLSLRRDDNLVVCLKFGTGIDEFPFKNGDLVDVAVTLKDNIYRSNRSLSVFVKDIQPSKIDQEKIFKDTAVYERFARNEELSSEDRALLTPSRDDMACVFRFLKGHGGFRFSTEMLYLRLNFMVEYSKLLVCIDIMDEFGFIFKSYDGVNTVINLSQSIEKKDFESSCIIRKLKAGK